MRPVLALLPDPWKKAPKRPDGKPQPARRPHRRSRPQLLTARDLDKRSNAYKAFTQMVADIEADLGGRDALSTIERTMVAAYVGAAITLQHFNTQLALGQQIDLTQLASAASVLVRIGGRLGLKRRARDVETLDQYLKREYGAQDVADVEETTP
jgi:hypothetical protein